MCCSFSVTASTFPDRFPWAKPPLWQMPKQKVSSSTYTGELTTDFKSRASGSRVKHRIAGNSVKGYGKATTAAGDLFRVETLTQNVGVFKTYRPKEGGPEDDLQWRIMRRGVADMHRRCEVSQKANERYWDALSTVDDSTRLSPDFSPANWQKAVLHGITEFPDNS